MECVLYSMAHSHISYLYIQCVLYSMAHSQISYLYIQCRSGNETLVTMCETIVTMQAEENVTKETRASQIWLGPTHRYSFSQSQSELV